MLLTALFLVAGCSSGNSGGGSGGQNTGVTSDGIVFSATVSSGDGISVDSITSLCVETEVNETTGLIEITGTTNEPGQTTTTGLLTIAAQRSFTLVNPSLFPSGVTFNGYTISYVSQSAAAPKLVQRHHGQSITLINDTSSVQASVILLDVGPTLTEFHRQNPGGTIYNYQVSITLIGQTLAGKTLTLKATTFLEVGNFDLCTA